MNVGTPVVAPEGWASMPATVVFHFLRSDARMNRVLLVLFSTDADLGNPKANLFSINRHSFETGLMEGKIAAQAQPSALPPWLEPLSGINLARINEHRSSKVKTTYSEYVEKRYLVIAPHLSEIEEILGAADPQAEINRRASQMSPRQNETRFRLWLLTYLCFGRDIWVLLPPFHRIGHWNRLDHPDKKFGAPSRAYGRGYGHGMSPAMAQQCVKSYLRRAVHGVSMTDIYDAAMTEDFHCIIVTLPNRMKVFSRPNGAPFPTYEQFRYRVKKEVGIEQIQRSLYGEVRHRTRIAASKGRFSEEVANLMERVEGDGRYLKERPMGYVEGSPLEPMCVVESRDVLSGYKLGIGFSLGKERGTAYRMMLFSMAVPKDFFCSLFGVTLKPGEWVSEGLPPHFAIDRGPGARQDLIAELESRFPIRDLAPSWSGQSKATVESGHTKSVHLEGEPSFLKSKLTPVEICRREIHRLIEFNNSSNMEDRIDPHSDMAFVPGTPAGLWQFYDERFRNDGVRMRLDDAVRTFLTPVKFSVKEDGIYIGARRFSSKQLQESRFFERYGKQGDGTTIAGYALDMCVRHAWVEIDGQLLIVEAKLRIRGAQEDLYMSLAELEQWSEARSEMQSAAEVNRHAVGSDIKVRFEHDTGKPWDAGKRKAGKPRKDAASRQESTEARPMGDTRRAA